MRGRLIKHRTDPDSVFVKQDLGEMDALYEVKESDRAFALQCINLGNRDVEFEVNENDEACLKYNKLELKEF